MAASADNLASVQNASKKGASKWRRRFKCCLICCSQSNGNLTEEAANLAVEASVVEGQLAHNEVDLTIKLEDLDNLLKHIKAKIQCLSTSSTPAASSSTSMLPCLYSRHKEISSFMESFPNDVKKQGGDWLMNLATRALGGAGGVHWLGLGLSLVAWTLDNFEQTAQNRDDCIQILQRIVSLLSNSKEIWEASPGHDHKTIETLQDTVSKAFRCAIVCTSYLNNNYFLRFLEAASAKDAIASLKEDLGCAVEVLDQHLIVRTFLNTAPNIEPQYSDSDDDEDDSVREPAVRAAKEKAMEYLKEDPDNTKALCLHGMGGIGKSTLGLSIFKSFQSCMKSYRYCRVELPFGIKDEQLHTIQNQILEKACSTKGTVSNPGEGKGKLKEELKKMDSPIFLFMDNVLESSHLGKMLPKASCFPGGSRILVTTRNEPVHNSILDDLKLERSKLIEVSKWEGELAKKFLWKQISRGKNKEVGAGSYPELELEKRVLALCDGLPLALKVVGRYIRNDGRDPTDPQVWKDVEEAMKNANPLDGSVEDELYCRLMFSLTVLDKDSTRAFLDIIAFGIGESWEAAERMVVGGHRHLEGLRKRALVRKRIRRFYHDVDDVEYCTLPSPLFPNRRLKLVPKRRSVMYKELVEVHDVLNEMGKKMMAKDKDEVRITHQDELLELKKSDSLSKAVGLKSVTVKAHQLKQMQHLRILHHVIIEGEGKEIQLDHLLVVRTEMRCRMNCITFGSKLKELSIWGAVQNRNMKVLEVCHELEILELNRWDWLENVDVIQSMTCLKELYLAWCKNLQSLPEGISNLSELKELTLTNCGNLQSLPEGISNLSKLNELTLTWCENLQSLPKGISGLKHLTKLRLCHCTSLQSLPESIGCLTGLTGLDLTNCTGLQSLPEAIGCLTGLIALDLIECRGLQSLPKAIGGLTGLTALSLRGCKGLQSLPEAIGGLTGLTALSLSGCEGLQSLPAEAIGGLTGLTALLLKGCRGLQSLPAEAIGGLTGLTELNLRYCGGLQSLPETIGGLTGLTELYLTECGGLQSLPEAIGGLTGLTELDLRLCGGLQSLPKAIGGLTGLTVLDLTRCRGLQSSNRRLDWLDWLDCIGFDGVRGAAVSTKRNCQTYTINKARLITDVCEPPILTRWNCSSSD